MDPQENRPLYGDQAPPAPPQNPQYIDASYGPYSGYGYTGASNYYPTMAGQGYPNYGNYGGYDYGGGGAASEFLSPRRLLKVLRRRWFMILLFTLVGCAAAILYFWKGERVYRSQALIEMSVRGDRILRDVVQQDFGKTEEVFNTRLGRLRGTRFGILAEDRFLALWEAHGRPVPEEERPGFGEISYNMMRQSRLVEISAESPDPLAAAISANAAAEAASTFFQEENRDLSDSAVQWLNRQVDVQKTQLNQTEDALLAFRSENNLDTLRAQLDADKQSLMTLNEMMIGYDNELLRAEEFLKSIEDIAIDLDEGVEVAPVSAQSGSHYERSSALSQRAERAGHHAGH